MPRDLLELAGRQAVPVPAQRHGREAACRPEPWQPPIPAGCRCTWRPWMVTFPATWMHVWTNPRCRVHNRSDENGATE